MLTFADPEIIQLASTEFIPVACDDWYMRRRNDDTGKFFRQIADQSPKDGHDGTSRQGIYFATADGQLLGYKNAGDQPEVMRREFHSALKKWKQTARNAITVSPHGPFDSRFELTPPTNGLVLKIFSRALQPTDKGFKKRDCDSPGGDRATRDFCWFTADEVRDAWPTHPQHHERFALPKSWQMRWCRFHFWENNRGDGSPWKIDDIRQRQFVVTITELLEDSYRFRIDGVATMKSSSMAGAADRELSVRVRGQGEYDCTSKTFRDWQMVGLAEYQTDGLTEEGASTGFRKHPIGFVFTLADLDNPWERLPPDLAKEPERYFDNVE